MWAPLADGSLGNTGPGFSGACFEAPRNEQSCSDLRIRAPRPFIVTQVPEVKLVLRMSPGTVMGS